MEKLTIHEVLKAVNGELLNYIHDIHDKKITGISIDSRTVSEGQLFIPIRGEHFDGHDFIEQSIFNGAIAYLTEKKDIIYPDTNIILVENTIEALQNLASYYRSKFNIPFIAVTGSSGKTTTKDMIASVLGEKLNVLKTQGNFNNEIGLPLTVFQLESTHRIAVIEIGMNHTGEIRRLVNIVKPDIAIITNIGLTHIEHLGSQDNIFKAKREILETLTRDQTALLNGDDPFLSTIDNELFKTVFLGIHGNKLDGKAFDIHSKKMGIDFKYKDLKNLEEEDYSLKLPGVHNVYNSMFAIYIGKHFGLSKEEIQSGLNHFKPSKMRMDIIHHGGLTIINDAYNANPDSMKAALEVLKNSGNNRKIAILGDMLEMGEWLKTAHLEIGKYVKQLNIDLLIAIGQAAQYYVEGSIEHGMEKNQALYVKNNKEAIDLLKSILNKGDIILIKGSRGMKLEEIVSFLQERG